MSERDRSHHFTFGSPDEDPVPDVHQEIVSLQVKKLNRRISTLALLLPVLTALIVLYGYLEIQKRDTRQKQSEQSEIDLLSHSLTARLESISARLDQAEKSLSETQAATRSAFEATSAKTLEAVDQKIEAIEKAVQGIDVQGAVQAVEKRQKALAAEVTEALKPLDARIEALSDEVKILDARLSEKVAAIEDRTGKNQSGLATVDQKVGSLSKSQLNREQLDLELLKVRKAQQVALDREIESLQRRLNTLSETVGRLESRFAGQTSPQRSTAPGAGIREQPLP